MYDQCQQQSTISRSSILYGTNSDDVWFNLDQFYKDQIQEVNQKLPQLDDGIWGKIVLMEKNKRVAKAYLRAPRFRLDGSCHEFDGQRIGFKSLNNPTRDAMVEEIREKVGVVLIKMDQQGNILAKRCEGSSPVIVQGTDRPGAYCIDQALVESRGRLEHEKPARVFDMRIFKASIEHELRQSSYPDRRRLLYKSVVRISLVKDEAHPFKTPCWFVLINLVALDMLNTKLVPVFPTISNTMNMDANGSELAISRCQSISSDLHHSTSNKHLSISTNDLYFAPSPTIRRLATNNNRDSTSSPIWSETYDEANTGGRGGGDGSGTTVTTAVQMANSLALGYDYGSTTSSLNRGGIAPRWSSALARSMDCLYGTAVNGSAIVVQSIGGDVDDDSTTVVQQQRAMTMDPTARRSAAVVQQSQRMQYGRGAGVGGGVNTLMPSDKRRSDFDTNGQQQQQEIYESTSTNSSNCSSGVSCRPSSPSVSSETTSESHHSADSMFASDSPSSTLYGKIGNSNTHIPATVLPIVVVGPSPPRRGSSMSSIYGHNMSKQSSFSSTAPDPPPRPQSVFKHALRSKIFGGFGAILTTTNGGESNGTKRAAMARYNNIRLDERTESIKKILDQQQKLSGRVSLFRKNSKNVTAISNQSTIDDASDSDSEVYRL